MANITYDEAIAAFEYRDGELFWKIQSARRMNVGDKAGSLDRKYKRVSYKGKPYLVHRIIYLMHHGYMPVEIDHINGNKLDNKIENLRSVTRSQNLYNKPANKNNTSGHKGVTWNNQKNAWSVRVAVEGKTHWLGFYDDVEIAGLIASEARAKLHGEYAHKA